jgi:hypothetical protein
MENIGAYDSLDSFVSEVSKLARKFERAPIMMDKTAIKDTLYGGIHEMMNNSKYFYYSNVGTTYCHWTDEGVKALTEYLKLMTPILLTNERELLDKRAKQLVLNGLKGKES